MSPRRSSIKSHAAETGSFNPGIPALKASGKYTEAKPERSTAKHPSAGHLPAGTTGTKGSQRVRHTGNPGGSKRKQAG